jgi:hypothetical protein
MYLETACTTETSEHIYRTRQRHFQKIIFFMVKVLLYRVFSFGYNPRGYIQKKILYINNTAKVLKLKYCYTRISFFIICRDTVPHNCATICRLFSRYLLPAPLGYTHAASYLASLVYLYQTTRRHILRTVHQQSPS